MNSSTQTADGWVSAIKAGAGRTVSQSFVIAAYLIFCAVSLVPFLTVAHPPIVDFANHAARLDLACHLGDPAIAAMYRYQLGIIPNLAVDLGNRPLCGVVPPATVLRGVIAASLLLIYFSGWLIQRQLFGRANAFLFVLPAIGLNLVTTMGYINFLAGVAVVCLMTALAIGREKQFRTMLLIGNIGGLVVFFCHVFALAFGVMIFFGLMLRGRPLTAKAVIEAGLRTLAMFALPLLLMTQVHGGGEPLTIGYGRKLRILPAPFMTQHAGAGFYGICLLSTLYGLFREKLATVDRSLRLSLATATVAVILLPSHIQNAVDVDSRMMVAVAYLFFPAIELRRQERAVSIVLAALSSCFAVFQIWATMIIWQPFSRQVDELRKGSDILPAQARVLTIVDVGPNLVAAPLAYSHVTSYVTMERRIFNPLEFTGVGMQPLSVTPAYAAVDTPTGQPYSPELANEFINPTPALEKLAKANEAGFALRWPQKFDYVILYHFGGPRNFNPALLSEVRSGSFFTILKVKKPKPL